MTAAPERPAARFVRRAVLVVTAGACLVLGYFAFAFGRCHSGPGFCGGDYSSTNTQAYAAAAVLGGLAAVFLAGLANPRRPAVAVAVAFPVGVAAVVVAALVAES